MKAGDEAIVNGQKRIWVICPDCSEGRWISKSYARQIRFTGRCQRCYMVKAKRYMERYHQRGANYQKEGKL